MSQCITMCWRCNTTYAYESVACPKCTAINANHDAKAAYKEMSEAGVTAIAHNARSKEIAEWNVKDGTGPLSGDY